MILAFFTYVAQFYASVAFYLFRCLHWICNSFCFLAAYFKLIGCRIIYFLGFYLVIACLFGYEDSFLNPGESGNAVYFGLSALSGLAGGLALKRNIQESGLDRYELSTIFASIVIAISAAVIESWMK